MTKKAVIAEYKISRKLYNKNLQEWKSFMTKGKDYAMLYINDSDYILAFHWTSHWTINDIPKEVFQEADWKQCIATAFCYGRLMPSKLLAKKDIVRAQSKYKLYNGKTKIGLSETQRGGIIRISIDADTHRSAKTEERILNQYANMHV